MDSKRAQTLEALSTFIGIQKNLLTRTQADIERLKALRNKATSQPESFVSSLSHELAAGSFKLSEQLECVLGPPEDVEWSLYAAHDTTPLKTLALTSRFTHAQQNTPSTTQRSDLSDLQRLVKDAKHTIIDPVLSQFPSEYSSDEEEPVDREELRRRERKKIRQLNREKTSCGLTEPQRPRDVNGIFIRQDLEDESGDVDICLDDDHEMLMPEMAEDETPTSLPSTTQPTPPPSTPLPLTKSNRTRRPTTKLQAFASRGNRRQPKPTTVKHEPVSEPPPSGPLLTKRGKPRPETYKLAWTLEEQHQLEQLLDEIPEGEKNRWQKISLAMNGRRTPRQVASRVQKYFEKLKLFGIG